MQGAGQEEQEEVVDAPVSILAACDPAKRKAPRKMAWSLTILFMEDNINGISFVPSINIGLSLEFILFHSWRMAFRSIFYRDGGMQSWRWWGSSTKVVLDSVLMRAR